MRLMGTRSPIQICLGVLLLFSVLLLAACDITFTEIEVRLSDQDIQLSESSVPEGAIVFQVRNEGSRTHEIIVLDSKFAPEALPMKGDQVDLKRAGPSEGSIKPERLFPGSSANHTFRLEPGYYVVISNLPGDYVDGLHVGLEVRGTH